MSSEENVPFKWSLDFTRKKHKKCVDHKNPIGYRQSLHQNIMKSPRHCKSNRLVIKKSWDLALLPLKQIPMNLFIIFMAGNAISIFPITMAIMLVLRPIKTLFAIKKTFKTVNGISTWCQKCIFIIGLLVHLFLALYKCHYMGLIPNYASDWLFFKIMPARAEYCSGGLIYT